MHLLVDFISDNGCRGVVNDIKKIALNLDKLPLLKEEIPKQRAIKRDAFSLVTVLGRWLIVYTSDLHDDETIMYFVDFRIEIDEDAVSNVFSSNTISGLKTLQLQLDEIFTPMLDTVELSLTPPFAKDLIQQWESELCINFTIALARKTGWILHGDALVDSIDPDNTIPESDRVHLRFYVGDNTDNIFDVCGVMKIQKFYQNVIQPLAINRARLPQGGISTKFYTESQLLQLPLAIPANEEKITQALAAIEENDMFLDCIPKRSHPLIPAHQASKFALGYCAPFAEALHDITKLPITAMTITEYLPQFQGSKLGYIHSFVLHHDGLGEDSWGKQTIEQIAKRFGALQYELSEQKHKEVVEKLKSNSIDIFKSAYEEASQLIKTYQST